MIEVTDKDLEALKKNFRKLSDDRDKFISRLFKDRLEKLGNDERLKAEFELSYRYGIKTV